MHEEKNVCVIVNWLLQFPAPQKLHICKGTPAELSTMLGGWVGVAYTNI